MQKKYYKFLNIVIICVLLVFVVGCQKRNYYKNQNTQNIKNIFIQYAQRDSDGTYFFDEYSDLSSVSFHYRFAYSPKYDLFNVNLLVTTYTSTKLYDYASITFSWGEFKKGLFSAYHELDSIARIEFEFNVLSYTNYNLDDLYTYVIKQNSFVNLTEKEDIDNYASDSYECLKQLVPYIRKVLNEYNIDEHIW